MRLILKKILAFFDNTIRILNPVDYFRIWKSAKEITNRSFLQFTAHLNCTKGMVGYVEQIKGEEGTRFDDRGNIRSTES